MLCERCHKDHDPSDFAPFYTIGVFCSWCRKNLEPLVEKYGVDGARTWIFEPRTDLIQLIEGEHKTILDCGCWAGYTMQALRDAGHTVYGLDIEDNRRVCKDAPFLEHDLECCIPPNSFIKKRMFDYILFGDVLEHLVSPDIALAEFRLALADGGKVLISVPNAGWIGSVFQIANQHFPRDESGHFDKTHMRFYTRDTLRDTLLDAGLKHITFYSKQLPDAVEWPEGAEGTQTFKWDNIAIDCDRDLLDQLNTYQILAVAWP